MLQEPDQSQKVRFIKLQRGVNRILSMRYTVSEGRAGSQLTPDWGAWSVAGKKPSAPPRPRASTALRGMALTPKKALDEPLHSPHLRELL